MPPAATNPQSQPHGYEDDNLEYKPWVKAVAWCTVALACLLPAYYAFYSLGYEIGRKDAKVEGEKRIAKMLLRMEDAQEKLMDVARYREELINEISDAAMRREMMGMLVDAVLAGEFSTDSEGTLREMLPPAAAPEHPAEAARMLRVAHWLARHGRWGAACAYLKTLEAADSKLVSPVNLLRERALMALNARLDTSATVRELEALVEQAKDARPELAMELYVSLGNLYRQQGDLTRSEAAFCAALKMAGLVDEATLRSPMLMVSYGIALYEAGDKEKALGYLEQGLALMPRGREFVDHRMATLQLLAAHCLEQGMAMEALQFLYRAEGEATGLLAADNPFWACLADQRGWALLTLQEYEKSLEAFHRAVQLAGSARKILHIQPLEGAARSCMAIGRSEEAVRAAQECCTLRAKWMPGDKAGLGQAYLLLGQAYDQAGHPLRAAHAYDRAAAELPADHELRLVALENCAYALMQETQWSDAARVWEALLERLPEDAPRYKDAKKNLDSCRNKSTTSAKVQKDGKAAPEATSASPS